MVASARESAETMASVVSSYKEFPPDPDAGGRRFGLALLAGILAEVLLVGGLVWYGESHLSHPVPPPKKQVMAVRMVTLPPPPKPIPPKPVVKPTPPKPVPPRPVIHHTPPPPPAPHPKMVVPPRPVPTPPAPPVKATPPSPKPVPVAKPVTPPAPPPPPPLSAAEKADLMGQYVATLRPIIQEQLHVPAELRAMGMSGTATIEFEVSPTGQVLWARVIKPSPLGAVNRAALAAIKSGNFPPFLKKMPKQNTVFEIPIEVGADSNG
jgi:protein TonB